MLLLVTLYTLLQCKSVYIRPHDSLARILLRIVHWMNYLHLDLLKQ